VLGSVPKGFIAGQNASQYKPSNPSLPKPDILAKILLNADLATQQISEAWLLLLETCLFGEWTKARLPTRPALLSAEKYRIAGTLITNRRRLAARSSPLSNPVNHVNPIRFFPEQTSCYCAISTTIS
jgi:hypothetical protein